MARRGFGKLPERGTVQQQPATLQGAHLPVQRPEFCPGQEMAKQGTCHPARCMSHDLARFTNGKETTMTTMTDISIGIRGSSRASRRRRACSADVSP